MKTTYQVVTAPAFRRLTRSAVLGLVLATAAVVFLYRIGAKSMWLDEVYHFTLARQTVQEILNSPSFEQMQMSHLYYLLVKASDAMIGNVDVAARLPQALCALASIVFVYLLGRHLFGTGTAILAALCTVFNAIFVLYAQENRFYQEAVLGYLAAYYFYVAYLVSRRAIHLVGFIIAMSFLLRAHSFGIVFGVVLGIVTILLYLTSLPRAGRFGIYDVNNRTLLWLMGAAFIVLVLYLPYPIRLFQYAVLKTIPHVQVTDGFWSGLFPLTIPALLKFVKTQVFPFLYNPTYSRAYAVIVLVGLVGSIWYGRSRAVLFVGATIFASLIVIHQMNAGKAEVMVKRFLYLIPCFVLLASGGISMAARMPGDLLQWIGSIILRNRLAGVIRCVGLLSTVTIWLVLVQRLVLPILDEQLYVIVQQYFIEKAPYRVLAEVLPDHIAAGETLFWSPGCNDAWLLEFYLPERNKLKLIQTDAWRIQSQDVNNAFLINGGVWLCNINPNLFGFPTSQWIHLTYGGRTVYGIRQALITNEALRAAVQEQLLRSALAVTEFPDIPLARDLTGLLLTRGLTNNSDAVTRRIASFHASREAAEFAANYYNGAGRPEDGRKVWYRHADLFFWRSELQQQAANLAFAAGDYPNAIRYATRWLSRFSPNYDQRAEMAGKAYSAMNDYGKAEKWFDRACSAVARLVKKGAASQARLASLQVARESAVLNLRSYDCLLEQLQARRGRPLSGLYPVEKTLTTIMTNESTWRLFSAKAEERAHRQPALALFVELVNTNSITKELVRDFAASVTAETWPIYLYAMQHLVPTNLRIDALVSWETLYKRGFNKFEKMSDASVLWLSSFYEEYLPYPYITVFYWHVSAKDPSRRWWSAVSSAEAAWRCGRTNDCLTILRDNRDVIGASPRAVARSASILLRK